MSLINSVYNRTVRPFLPPRIGVYSGVAVRDPVKLLDREGTNPHHKDGMVDTIQRGVREGDTVVEVGAGMGILTVHAARRAGPMGCVHAYEGGQDNARTVRQTVRLNEVEDRVNVNHTVVEYVETVWGSPGTAAVISVEQLPEMDVLVMDCEGAEVPILKAMQHTRHEPRECIVETHAWTGADSATVTELLEANQHEVVGSQPAAHQSPNDNRAIHAEVSEA